MKGQEGECTKMWTTKILPLVTGQGHMLWSIPSYTIGHDTHVKLHVHVFTKGATCICSSS